VQFSGKITNSVITFLQTQGVEVSQFYELTDVHVEFLKDPTCWLEAKKTEALLGQLESWAMVNLNLENPIEKIGHSAKELCAWGVLDSVLRMIERPQDIFLQPQRFISYFISPAPPIANIQRGESSVSFDLPISFEEYPHVASYIRAAIEAIPQFMGAQMAEAQWKQNRVTVSWSQTQSQMTDELVERRQMAPDVMQNLILTLEKTELALLEKTRELDKIKEENALAAQSQVAQLTEIAHIHNMTPGLQQQILRLQDYFTRSQQLITLLVGQNRLSPQVREAMRRVNWETVQKSFSEVTQELLSEIENGPTEQNTNHQSSRTTDSGQSWLSHS
jgi:hypothetical protein